MKNRLIILIIGSLMVFSLTGCAALDRQVKDWKSSQGNGLNRTLTVYDNNGNEIKKYTGKFDIETNDYGNKVKFDVNGKRVIVYNATVITEED